MTQLSTEQKNKVIIFHDGSKLFITSQQEELIYQISGTPTKHIRIDGNMYAFSTMAKIIDLKDYYDQYPEQRPETREEIKIETDNRTLEQIAESSKENYQGLLKGLKQFIDEEITKGVTPKHAIELFNSKVSRYKQLYT